MKNVNNSTQERLELIKVLLTLTPEELAKAFELFEQERAKK